MTKWIQTFNKTGPNFVQKENGENFQKPCWTLSTRSPKTYDDNVHPCVFDKVKSTFRCNGPFWTMQLLYSLEAQGGLG
jgi:hypothetical protein